MAKKPQSSLRVEIDAELHRQAKIKAATTGETISDRVRKCLREWVDEEHPIITLPPEEKDQT